MRGQILNLPIANASNGDQMKRLAVLAASTILLSPDFFAQNPAPADNHVATLPASGKTAALPSPPEGLLARWLTINTLSVSYRWRDMTDYDAFRLFDSGQERYLADGGLKLDSAGKYSINFHVSSGRNFNWAYSDSLGDGFWELITPSRKYQSAQQLLRKAQAVAADPAGNASYDRVSRGSEIHVRELFLSASPIRQLTFEYGGIGIERGENTEITSYDDDGYMAGGRMRIRDPRHLFFDQIAVTYGYMGDYFDPNLFDRGNRFGQTNYHQFLLQKRISARIKASADYTWQNHVQVMREAAVVNVRESKFANSARFELYQRTNNITLQGATFASSSGFAIMAEKTLGEKTILKKFKLEGGYASVDEHYSVFDNSRALDAYAWALNGDTYGIGRRLIARSTFKINPYISCFGVYTHTVATDYYNKNKQGMNFGLTIDFKNLLNDKFQLGIAPYTGKKLP